MHTLRAPIAVASLLFFLSGCPIEDLSSDDGFLAEGACAETTKSFDVSGAAEPFLLLTQLPAGVYRHSGAEIYVESKLPRADGTTSVSRVHFLATPVADTDPVVYSKAIRCRESDGKFSPYFTQAAMIANFTNYDRTRFDVATLAYAVNFSTDLEPTLFVSNSGDVRRAGASTVANTISAYWNSSYRFARRSGETYEFYGVRFEADSGRTIFGKSIYSRTSL